MSLATRCTACGTVFRVVQDQLKVSEGWVRCGRCAEVFDAREQLFDLEREAPPPWPAQAQAPEGSADDSEFEATRLDSTHAREAQSAWPSSDREALESAQPGDADLDRPALDEFADDDEPMPDEFADASRSPPSRQAARTSDHSFQLPADYLSSGDRQTSTGAAASSVTSDLGALAAHPDDSPLPKPSFMRKAGEQRPAIGRVARALWIAAGLLLALLLELQAVVHYRDRLATLDPQLNLYLKKMCELLSCEVRPLQLINAISVESSSLTRAPGDANHYQLSVSLLNRANTALALPSVDLSLTDSAGSLLARRVLKPGDFSASAPHKGAAAGTIAAKSQIELQTLLQAGDARLVGYTVEVFYP